MDDFINYGIIDQNASFDLSWPDQSCSTDNDISSSGLVQQENENMWKSWLGTQACCEIAEREIKRLRPARTDKLVILDDAFGVLNRLRTEAQEFKETNEKLQEETRSLKAEKNELCDKKLILQADKEKIEKQLKSMAIPTAGFVPTHRAAYHAGLNKMAVYPSYDLIPMWQYLQLRVTRLPP